MRDLVGKEATAEELLAYALWQEGVAAAVIGHHGIQKLEENARLVRQIAGNSKAAANCGNLEKRLAHLAGPHALSWARTDYFDGMIC